jgi:hypothetical protein
MSAPAALAISKLLYPEDVDRPLADKVADENEFEAGLAYDLLFYRHINHICF